MAGLIILGALAAIGAMSLFWAILGWLLPAGQGCLLVCFGAPDEGILSRYRWLRGMGLLRCGLLSVEADCPCPGDDVEYCCGESVLSRLEWERKQSDGTGTGDPPGHGQCRGVSEL